MKAIRSKFKRSRKTSQKKIRSKVDGVVATVEKKVHDAVVAGMNKLVIPRGEPAPRSANASSGRGHGSVVFDFNGRIFRGVRSLFRL